VHICAPHCDLLHQSHPAVPCLSAYISIPRQSSAGPAQNPCRSKDKGAAAATAGIVSRVEICWLCETEAAIWIQKHVRVGWREKLETPLQGARATAGKLAT